MLPDAPKTDSPTTAQRQSKAGAPSAQPDANLRNPSGTCVAGPAHWRFAMKSKSSDPNHPTSVLIADPCYSLAESLSREFRALGCVQVWYAEHADEACNLATLVRPDLAVLELRFEDHSGLALLREIREISPSTRCVILTAYGSMEAAVRAVRLGATTCLTKPASAREIIDDEHADTIETSLPALRHMSLQRATWEYLQRVFEKAPSVSEAARRLGLDRSSLRRMLSRTPPSR
jgi:two-component system, response regulator RegA